MSQPLIPEEPQSGRRVKFQFVTFALVVLLTAYFVVLVRNASYAVGGSDSSGYANRARALSQGRIRVPVSEVETFGVHESLAHVFVPLGYTPVMKDGNATRVMLPFYPIGLPLHELVAALLLGWRLGPFLVSPLLAALSCWLVTALGGDSDCRRCLLQWGPSYWLSIQPSCRWPCNQ
ncbi:MAG: hypothetical protein ABI882_12015 [Acidobacteriota bacterium]